MERPRPAPVARKGCCWHWWMRTPVRATLGVGTSGEDSSFDRPERRSGRNHKDGRPGQVGGDLGCTGAVGADVAEGGG